MIYQQCYTRERRGLFRQSEGYDSIAKSPGLDDCFIKEFIHPFCVYNTSRALQAENTPAGEYPEALTVIRYPDGRMLLGQAVYVSADFTGQRSTFFAHNYVLSPTDAEALDMPAVLYETAFLTGYDIDSGKEMPVLDALPHTYRSALESPADTLSRLGIGSAMFCHILQCLLQSLAGTKKVYIVPPVAPQETTRYAKALLMVLYQYLPPSLTRHLGFVTYSREPENKKGLHVSFLERGVVRPGDPRVSRDFFVDLARIPPGDTDSAYGVYLWEQLTQARDMAAFYTFAENFTPTVSLSFWDGLTDIYRVFLDTLLYASYGADKKRQFLYTLRQYLPLASKKHGEGELYAFTTQIILNEDRMVTDGSYASAREVLIEIAGFYGLSHGAHPFPDRLIARVMYHNACANEQDRPFIADLIRNTDTTLMCEYVGLLIEKQALAYLDAYLIERVATLPLHALFDEMRFWLVNAPDVFLGHIFSEAVCAQVLSVMEATQDAVTTAGLAYQRLKAFHTEQKTHRLTAGYDRFILSVMDAIDAGLLPRIDVDTITTEQLAALPDAFLRRGKKGSDPVLFVKLEILKKLSAPMEADREETVNLRYFLGSYRMDAASQHHIIQRLRGFYRERVKSPQFDNIVFLFRNIGKPGLDAAGLLSYMDEYGGTAKGEFLVWAEQTHVFNLQNPAHMDAVRLFIKNNIKDSAFKERIYENMSLKTMAREIRFGRLAGML